MIWQKFDESDVEKCWILLQLNSNSFVKSLCKVILHKCKSISRKFCKNVVSTFLNFHIVQRANAVQLQFLFTDLISEHRFHVISMQPKKIMQIDARKLVWPSTRIIHFSDNDDNFGKYLLKCVRSILTNFSTLLKTHHHEESFHTLAIFTNFPFFLIWFWLLEHQTFFENDLFTFLSSLFKNNWGEVYLLCIIHNNSQRECGCMLDSDNDHLMLTLTQHLIEYLGQRALVETQKCRFAWKNSINSRTMICSSSISFWQAKNP